MSPRRVSAQEARANFGCLLASVYYTGEPVIVEKRGRAFAVVISPDDYRRLAKDNEEAWATIDRIRERNADKDPDEVLQDVTAEVEAVRKKREKPTGRDSRAGPTE